MQNVFSVPVFKAGIILVSSSFYGIFFVLFVLSTLILNRQGKRDPGSQMSSTNFYLVSSYMMFVVLSAVSENINTFYLRFEKLKPDEPVHQPTDLDHLCNYILQPHSRAPPRAHSTGHWSVDVRTTHHWISRKFDR